MDPVLNKDRWFVVSKVLERTYENVEARARLYLGSCHKGHRYIKGHPDLPYGHGFDVFFQNKDWL